jgi:putative ABC transport system permease protein
LRVSALAAGPAAACGALAAIALTPGADEPLGWWLAGLTALVALAGVPVLAVLRARSAATGAERADRPLAPVSLARRLVSDLTMILAAIGGVVLLRQQGVVPGGNNWYTSAAPVLVAVPLAIVVARGYPLALRWLVRLTGRRQGVAAFVGLARAARGSSGVVLPAFALVLALGVVGFGAMLRTAVVRGDDAQSWYAVGADAVVDGSNNTVPISAAAQRAIAAVPGVQRTAELSLVPVTTPSGTQLQALAVAPASYAAVVASSPLPAFPAAALAAPRTGPATAVPVLASPAAANVIGRHATILIGGKELAIKVVGRVGSIAGPATSGPFLLLPDWALGRRVPRPNLMLIAGPGIDASKLQAVAARTAPGAPVTMRSHVLAALLRAPLPYATYITFTQGTVAAAGFGAVIVLIMLALAARPREVTLARLYTMGLSPRQARRLVLAEALPPVLAAAAAGIAAAFALVPLLDPAINLSVFTGSAVPVVLRTDLGVLGYLAAGLLIASVVTVVGQSAATRLRGDTRTLRAGE